MQRTILQVNIVVLGILQNIIVTIEQMRFCRRMSSLQSESVACGFVRSAEYSINEHYNRGYGVIDVLNNDNLHIMHCTIFYFI